MGGTWEATGDSASGSAFRIQSTFDWEPSLEVVRARSCTLNGDGEATPWLEAYVYRQVRTDALACLALSRWGAVYEGNATVLDGGALQFDLKAYEDDRSVPQVARFELGKDGRLRTRVWSVDGAGRTLRLDVEHTRVGSKRD